MHNYLQDGISPIFIASQNGHTEVVDLLVQAGADIHLATTKVHVSTHTVFCSVATVLEINVSFSVLILTSDYIIFLTISMLRVNDCSLVFLTFIQYGSVPLEIAAENGHTKTVQRLLEAGPNVNHQNKVMTVNVQLP